MGKVSLYTFKGWVARTFKLIVGALFLAGGALMIEAGIPNPMVTPNPMFLFIGALLAFGGLLTLGSAVENDEVSLTLGSDRNDPD